MDIEYDRAYRVTELVVRKERLAKDNLKTFDIALLKLDRKVSQFTKKYPDKGLSFVDFTVTCYADK